MPEKITDEGILAGFKELKDLFKETDAQFKERFKETEAQFKERFKETEAQFKETDKKIAEMSETVKKMSKELGGIGNNNGAFAEEYFVNALDDKKMFAGQKFDELERSMKAKDGNLKDEFDIVMYNGVAVAIIEVKYKVHENDLEKLVTKKVQNFRELFPYYRNYKIYLGIGSMSFYANVLEKAKKLGIGILKQKGETIEIDADNVTAY
ncbi:hypothetical protein AGMMS50267_15840 [Spirochaetia bacterium]|nr:hypothetical protein AGMMS50267_15840 [Spirochaetia bacterium]